MKKTIIGWSIVVGLAAGAFILYASVPAVRGAVVHAMESLGLGEVQEDVTYWCPMHPEIVRKSSGTCPV